MAIEFYYDRYPGRSLHINERIMEGKPLISVVTVAPDEDQVSRETKNSLNNQTFPRFEWIVAETRKAGALKATGEYILFLDPGDQMEPTFLEYCLFMLRKDKKAAFATTAYCVGGEDGYICDDSLSVESIKTLLKDGGMLPAAVFRRSVIEKALKLSKDDEKEESLSERNLWYFVLSMEGHLVQSHGEALFWRKAKLVQDIETKDKDYVFAPHATREYPIKRADEHDFHRPKRSDITQRIYRDDGKTGVLFLLHWFSRGGADRFNIDLIKGVDRDKYHVAVATTLQGENEWLQRARDAADDIFNLPNFMDIPDFPEFLSYLIGTRNIKLLFIDISVTGYYLLPWLKKEYPYLCVVDYIHMVERFWKDGGYARLAGITAPLTDHTYVCNSATAGELVSDFHMEERKVSTAYIGIDHEHYDVNKVRGGILYEAMGIQSDRPIILFPCRICPQKRPFLMIKIAEQVVKTFPDAAFIVVGDGPDLSGMKAEVGKKGLNQNVYFSGTTEEMRPFYRDAKLTLICSLSEGLTLTAYESLSMGVPVISADVGGQRDLIDGEVGALIPFMQDEKEDYDSRTFPAEEIGAYTAAITEFLTDKEKWEKASKAGRKRIEERFTTQRMIDFFNSEFSRLLNDETLKKEREENAAAAKLLGAMAEEYYVMYMMTELYGDPECFVGKQERDPFAYDISQKEINEIRRVLHAHGKMLESHEKAVVNFDEVLTRHEEVVNRHEESINHHWGVQKWHEERLQKIENKNPLRRIWRKLK